MLPGCGCSDKHITLRQKQLVKACLANRIVRGAGLHCHAVLRRKHQKEWTFLAITRGQHIRVTGSVSVVKLVSGVRPNNVSGVMWRRFASPSVFNGSLFTTFVQIRPHMAVEVLGFNCDCWGCFGQCLCALAT